MVRCIFCDGELNAATKPEHILLSALGGRKTTTRVICSTCNSGFGSTIDKAVSDQMAPLRNLLKLPSGTGKPPPTLRRVQTTTETIDMRGDGPPELVMKPFTITDLGDGRRQLSINARSVEDIARSIPHIAAQLRCSEEEAMEHIAAATAQVTTRRPGVAHFSMPLGGEDVIRSFARACLVLWATHVGNEEVKSARYQAVRDFITTGDESFDEFHIDTRFLPPTEELQRLFGDFFNLIYVRSNENGRVIGHFTLYNIIGYQFVLAEGGATPSAAIGLASNPMDPGTWSDAVANDVSIDFAWLAAPDSSDQFERTHQRMSAAIERAQRDSMSRQLGTISHQVFEKYGLAEITSETDPELAKTIFGEISRRAAMHIMSVPFTENLPGEEIIARLRAARSNES
jgi:hypothetical protein